MTTVELQHISKNYDGRRAAVRDLSLSIPSGQITALLGPSGCGKTTTLKMIAGLLPPTAGQVFFDARNMTQVPAEKRQAAMVFQNHLLFPYMNVLQNVGFGLKMRGIPTDDIRRRVAAMLEQVQLAGYEERRPAQLSGGQQQRVALARALIIEPEVLLLDEPLSNLDAHLREEMRNLILSLQRQFRITTIFVTHNQEEAVLLADRIALMFAGELQQVDPPRAFYERPQATRIARFFGGVNFLPGRLRDGCFCLNDADPGLVLTLDPALLPSAPSGAICATIRPEHLQLAENGDDESPNTFAAVVKEVTFRGTHTRLQLLFGSHTLALLAPSAVDLKPGDDVRVRFPPEKIWLLAE